MLESVDARGNVSRGTIGNQHLGTTVVQRARHAAWGEDVSLQERAVVLVGSQLDDVREQVVVRVAVPVLAGLGGCTCLLQPASDDVGQTCRRLWESRQLRVLR